MWPFEGRLEEYVARSGTHYAHEMKQAAEHGPRLLTVDASFRTTLGSHRRREVVLWQKVVQPEGMLRLLTHELPAHYRRAGYLDGRRARAARPVAEPSAAQHQLVALVLRPGGRSWRDR